MTSMIHSHHWLSELKLTNLAWSTEYDYSKNSSQNRYILILTGGKTVIRIILCSGPWLSSACDTSLMKNWLLAALAPLLVPRFPLTSLEGPPKSLVMHEAVPCGWKSRRVILHCWSLPDDPGLSILVILHEPYYPDGASLMHIGRKDLKSWKTIQSSRPGFGYLTIRMSQLIINYKLAVKIDIDSGAFIGLLLSHNWWMPCPRPMLHT